MSLPPFQRLVDAHATSVHRYLLAALGREDAADAFQETFLAALRAYPELRSAENLRGWLFTIARNKALDSHRARARRPVPVAAVPEDVRLDDTEPTSPVLGRGTPVARPPAARRAAALRRRSAVPRGGAGHGRDRGGSSPARQHRRACATERGVG